MPGAGSIRAANYLYNVAPKDGTVFGGFARGIFLDPLLGRAEAMRFTPAKFGWLGSVSNDIGRLRVPGGRRHRFVGRHADQAL